jgi:hypothetical protein
MALEYIKTKVLTPYDRNILPITTQEFALYGDTQGIYDITADANKINKYIAIARDSLEDFLSCPLFVEEWVYSAYTDTPYKKIQIVETYITECVDISIKTSDIDISNQYLWFNIPYTHWFLFTKHKTDFLNNIVEIQSSADFPSLNTLRSPENIKIKFNRGIFSNSGSVREDIKMAIALVVFQMMEGVRNPDISCIVESIIDSYNIDETFNSF